MWRENFSEMIKKKIRYDELISRAFSCFFSLFAISFVFLFNRAKAGRIGKMNRMPRGNVFLIFYSCCLREPRLFSSRFDLNLEVGVRIAYSSNVESVYRRARELEGREEKKREEICTSPAWNDEWAALSILLSDIVLTIKGKRCEKPGANARDEASCLQFRTYICASAVLCCDFRY